LKTHKLGLIDTATVIDTLLGFFSSERVEKMKRAMGYVADHNEKIGYLRSCVIGVLVQRCAETFVEHEEAILRGEFRGSLIEHIPQLEREGYERCNALSWDKIYRAPDVVDIELAGTSIITFLLDKLIHAILYPQLNYSRLLLSRVPQQYEVNAPTLYGKIQAAVDHISGMTDVYALDLYQKLSAQSLKIQV
jgi:dGTPase